MKQVSERIEKISDLRELDVVRNMSGAAYVVTAVFSNRATAVRTADITNPDEWMRVIRSDQAR